MKILMTVIIWVTVMDDDDIEKVITSLQLVCLAIFSVLAFEITLSGLPCCKECSLQNTLLSQKVLGGQ